MAVEPLASRLARASETNRVVETITLAFEQDPIWSVALAGRAGSTDHHAPYWRLFVTAAMRFETVRVTDDLGACAVWLPPGADELDADDMERLDAWFADSLEPSRVDAIHVLYARFEASRAAYREHAYLSLLATHPDRRGRGVGQRLLAADLSVWDALGVPAYLESTNPANDHRYQRAGFRPIGGFDAVLDTARVTAFRRPTGGDPPG
jgi:GNAT superfamily N-acetyltransferase